MVCPPLIPAITVLHQVQEGLRGIMSTREHKEMAGASHSQMVEMCGVLKQCRCLIKLDQLSNKSQSALQSCGGGSLLNHYQCAASTWMMWRQPQYNGASALTTHQLQVERRERVIEPIKWLGVIRRPWLTRDSSGNLARTPGLHPYSLWEVSWDLKWPQRVRT